MTRKYTLEVLSLRVWWILQVKGLLMVVGSKMSVGGGMWQLAVKQRLAGGSWLR